MGEPVKIRDAAHIEELKGYNRHLAQLFGGDKCQSLEHLMRLPGTINWPGDDKKKRNPGRGPAPARVVECRWTRLCDLDGFERAEASKANGADRSAAATKVNLPDRLPDVVVADLPVSDVCKTVIVEGKNPEDETKKHWSRSEWMYGVVCALARADCTDEVMAAVLLDPANGVSACVRDKPHPREYAARQVEQAKEAVAKGWPDVNKKGNPTKTYRNARRALIKTGLEFSHDLFHEQLFVQGRELGQWAGEVTDKVDVVLRDLIISGFGFDAGKGSVHDATLSLCLANSYDPLLDWLAALEWDGVERTGTWLVDYLGAEDNPYVRAVGLLFLAACLRRAHVPGCKWDHMLVLEGPQDIGKSTAFRILAGDEFFSDAPILHTKTTREELELTLGVWIHEVADLSGLGNRDVETIKAYITRQSDKARAAYARHVTDRPRRFVLVGTTNKDRYLHDETGNRRFLPVKVGKIDLDRLRADRAQLWAEAMQAMDQRPLILPRAVRGEAVREQEVRVVVNEEWVAALATLRGALFTTKDGAREWRINSAEVWGKLEIPVERRRSTEGKMAIAAMRALGWEGPEVIYLGGGPNRRGYVRPVSDEEAQEGDGEARKGQDDLPF